MLDVLISVERWRSHVENSRHECAESELRLLRDHAATLERWQESQGARIDEHALEDIRVRATRAHVDRAKKARPVQRPRLRIVPKDEG